MATLNLLPVFFDITENIWMTHIDGDSKNQETGHYLLHPEKIRFVDSGKYVFVEKNDVLKYGNKITLQEIYGKNNA